MLRFDPDKRCTVDAAIDHPYFAGLSFHHIFLAKNSKTRILGGRSRLDRLSFRMFYRCGDVWGYETANRDCRREGSRLVSCLHMSSVFLAVGVVLIAT